GRQVGSGVLTDVSSSWTGVLILPYNCNLNYIKRACMMDNTQSFRCLALTVLLSACGSPVNGPPETAGWQPVKSSYVAHQNEKFGVPTFIGLEPAGPPPAGTPPAAVAQQVLKQLAPLYRLSDAALAAATVHEVHDTGQGAVIARVQQQVASLDVFRMTVNI